MSGARDRELSSQAEKIDDEEDALYGKGRDAHDIPDELKRREGRRKRIDQARRELEQEARAAREKELRKRAGHQRKTAETEPDPVERKRKRTRARKAEEEADSLAAESDEGTASEEAQFADARSASWLGGRAALAPPVPSESATAAHGQCGTAS